MYFLETISLSDFYTAWSLCINRPLLYRILLRTLYFYTTQHKFRSPFNIHRQKKHLNRFTDGIYTKTKLQQICYTSILCNYTKKGENGVNITLQISI